METRPTFAGIDVAKARLDVAVRPAGTAWAAPNDEAGIDAVVARLQPLAPVLVVPEATGGLEVPLAAALAAAGRPVAVVTPRQVRDFAKAVGQLAKTDALDARLLARVAEAVRPPARSVPDAKAQALAALLARRRQTIAMLVAEQQRLGTALPAVRPRVERHIAWLREELADVDGELARAIRASPAWREADALLRGVPGVGPVLATTLVADLPELGRLDRKAIAALVGVAPLACESGILRGRRVVWGGRARVRAARSIGHARRRPPQPAHPRALRPPPGRGQTDEGGAGRLHAQALDVLNAILRHRTPWRPGEPAAHPA